MGSDNSGKRGRSQRFLLPLAAACTFLLVAALFLSGDAPTEVNIGDRPAALYDTARHVAHVAMRGTKDLMDKTLTVEAKVEERLHGSAKQAKPVASIEHVLQTFRTYLNEVHRAFDEVKVGDNPELTAEQVWDTYLKLTERHLLPLDMDYAPAPVDKKSETIFISMATYRDENCPRTITEAFKYADNPEKLYVGLVEQNCYSNCKTGVLKDQTIKDAPPDVDCYKEFCEGEQGQYCDRLRLLRINESESLGPASARYFASKLWYGESYYLQIDAHMFFAPHWDTITRKDMELAERPKPVITNYPPPDSARWQNTVGLRMCDAFFTEPGIEAQIVRLEGSSQMEREIPPTPRFAPFIAAGFFFTLGDFLHEVPFDPFVPWIFMGEEIMLSARAFTNGYNIFSPTQNVLAHIYVRRNKPKFWETVGRAFKRPGFHNRLNALVIRRVKNILGYPECDDHLLWPATLGAYKEMYGMGRQRTLQQYMDMVGLDAVAKTAKRLDWCHKGETPPQLLQDV